MATAVTVGMLIGTIPILTEEFTAMVATVDIISRATGMDAIIGEKVKQYKAWQALPCLKMEPIVIGRRYSEKIKSTPRLFNRWLRCWLS